MAAVITSLDSVTPNSRFTHFKPNFHSSQSSADFNPSFVFFPSRPPPPPPPPRCWSVKACTADREIDMVKTKDGVYAAKAKKVVVLWDLDNKPPRGPPFEAAMALKWMAQKFGEVIDMSAYANRHAFIHLPQWVVEERREQRRVNSLERKGLSTAAEPYACSVCGRKCRTHMDLKKHFRQLHERERQKKLNRMRSLKGGRRQRYKERFIDGNEKYNEAARRLLTPKIGYGLAQELKRAGVFVKTVEDKPQAADWALKRQMLHSMTRGVDWIVLVSDDSDFSEVLGKAKDANLGTVVVGDRDRALGKHADIWVPWNRVESREIKESDLDLNRERWRGFDEDRNETFSLRGYNGEEDDGHYSVDDIVERIEFDDFRISAFSEGEEEEYEEEYDVVRLRLNSGDNVEEGDYLLTSEDDEFGDAYY